jgi:CBS domain-containing protein
MKCFELMKTDLVCCNANDLVEDVASCMRSRNVGFVPICDGNGAAVGTLTDRDLAMRVLAERRRPEHTRAGDVMSPGVVSCRAEDELSVCEQLMSKRKISRILCLDGKKRPVGVISLSDVAERETAGKASAILRSVAQREARP